MVRIDVDDYAGLIREDDRVLMDAMMHLADEIHLRQTYHLVRLKTQNKRALKYIL